MPKHLLHLWILALVYLSDANAEPAIQIEILPAWNGHFKSEKSTELKIKLNSQRGGTYSVETDKLFKTVTLEANTPYTTALPFRAAPRTDTSVIRVYKPDNPELSATQNIRLTASNHRSIAFVSDNPGSEEHKPFGQALNFADKTNLLTVNVDSLPRFVSGYEAIDLLVMPYSELKRLHERQIVALSGYLALCGKMIAIAFPKAVYQKLRESAGCGSEFLIAATSANDLASQAGQILNGKSAPLPDLSLLPATQSETKALSPYLLLLIFCFAYLSFVLIVYLIGRRKKTFFIVPLSTASVAILIWHSQQPEKHLLSWVEIDSERSAAHYKALLKMNGTGKWQETVALPIEAALSAANPQQQDRGELLQDTVSSNPSYSLLSSSEWQWHGAMNLNSPLALKVDGNQAMVYNTGEQGTEAGLMRWQGKIYVLPPLTAGQSWSPESAPVATDSELVRLLAKQSVHSASAVLIPFLPAILPFEVNHNGWLLIHAAEATP
jgi:hypothetical protein